MAAERAGHSLEATALVQDLGEAPEAAAALERAKAIVATMPDPAPGRAFDVNWHDWLHCHALVPEAERVLADAALNPEVPSPAKRGAASE